VIVFRGVTGGSGYGSATCSYNERKKGSEQCDMCASVNN
jgi:hypothetical protein